ncbi:cell wall protein [Streptomyces sp. NPDC002643]
MPAFAASDERPGCLGADSAEFPIRTRIRGGPDTYVAGGGFHTWSLELTNTTTRRCARIHPVVVLVDGARTLKRTQPQLEFYEHADSTTSRPVTFEQTDSDELVGVLDEEGRGFTVPPGRTLTVKVRLSITSDAAVPNDIVASAAIVERHGDDSEWVGESDDYRFRIVDEDDPGRTEESGHEDDPGRTEEPGPREEPGPSEEEGEGRGERGEEGVRQETEAPVGSGEGSGRDGGSEGRADERSDGLELAGTGAEGLRAYGAGVLLLSAGGLLVAVGWRRSRGGGAAE